MQTLQVGRLGLELGRRTYIMGILNVTPDSFSGNGLVEVEAAVARGRALLSEGADILDVGGESTRPGAHPVPVEEELRRVVAVVERLVGEFGAPVSVDTQRAEVARQALRAGAAMVNDVSALRADVEMAPVVAEARVPVVFMHMGTRPSEQQQANKDIVTQVRAFLAERIEVAVSAGVLRQRILVDPGFGFGKTVQQNLELLRRLGEFRALGQPLLISTSRKGTIGKVLDLPVEERVEGTAATVAVAIMQGADIVRVHDVRAMVRVARVTDAVVRDA